MHENYKKRKNYRRSFDFNIKENKNKHFVSISYIVCSYILKEQSKKLKLAEKCFFWNYEISFILYFDSNEKGDYIKTLDSLNEFRERYKQLGYSLKTEQKQEKSIEYLNELLNNNKNKYDFKLNENIYL